MCDEFGDIDDVWDLPESNQDIAEDSEGEFYQPQLDEVIRDLDIPADMEEFIRTEVANGNSEVENLLGLSSNQDVSEDEQKVKTYGRR